MRLIVLGPKVGLDEIVKWPTESVEPVIFRVSHSTDFLPFAEGVAVAAIQQMHLRGISMAVERGIIGDRPR